MPMASFTEAFQNAFQDAFQGGAAAPAVPTHLFKMGFTRADQVLADTNTIGPPDSGATYETTESDGVGVLTAVDLAANANVQVLSNELKIDTIGAHGVNRGLGAFSDGLTLAAGSAFRFDLELSDAGSYCFGYFAQTNQGLNATAATMYANSARIGTSSDAIQMGIFDAAGATIGIFHVANGPTPLDGVPMQYALTMGGYDSAGLPAADKYGMLGFAYNGANWELIAAGASDTAIDSAARYFCFGDMPTIGVHTDYVDNISVPVALFPEVSTPTGYALDRFEDTNGVLLSAHTADATYLYSAGANAIIQNNLVECTSSSSWATITGVALTSYWLEHELTPRITNTTNYSSGGIFIRNNGTAYFEVRMAYNAGDWKLILYEFPGGNIRDSAVVATPVDNVPMRYSVRVTPTDIEAWLDGVHASKVSYASATGGAIPTTGWGSSLYVGTPPGPVKRGWLQQLPLTAAEYDTALDAA
ncbi:MAG: hypothetical protein GWP74_16890 [Proteobacteria bacterium]|nr:hypothetical protein [Pseudomonadota bacterium]